VFLEEKRRSSIADLYEKERDTRAFGIIVVVIAGGGGEKGRPKKGEEIDFKPNSIK